MRGGVVASGGDVIGPVSEVRAQRTFRATADEVFAAWLTPAALERWMFGRAPGEEIVRLDVDARVGGCFSFLVRREGQDIVHVGEYLELDTPRRLAFTWDVGKRRADGSRVEIDLTPVGDSVTLTLVHHLPADAAPYANQTKAGWMRMLGALAGVLEGG